MVLAALLALSVSQVPPSMVVVLVHPGGELVLAQEDATDEVAKPERFTTAFCGATSSAASFVKTQKRAADFNGNFTPRNFEKSPGTVYKLATKVTSEDVRYCVLLTADVSKQQTLLAVTVESKPCEKKPKVSKDKPTKCTEIARFEGGRFSMLEYARKKRVNPVVRFVASYGERDIVTELKASGFEPPSCWRVDDSCESPVGSYTPVLAMKKGDELTVLTLWGGAEGDSLSLDVSDGRAFKTIGESYFYNSP